jgi:hypothetical protein
MKVVNTRKQKIAELTRMIKDGPAFSSLIMPGGQFDQSMTSEDYQRWAETWVMPLINDLVPELKKQKKDRNND